MSGGPPAENAGELAPPELRLRHCLATGSAGNPNARAGTVAIAGPAAATSVGCRERPVRRASADFLGVMGALILRARKDQIRPYLPDAAGVPSPLPSSPEKTSPGLEQGWLLAEMEQRFSYTLPELARRFDRSVSWVARRLALVELLPEAIQLQVRAGQIAAQVAMKYLVPVARVEGEQCRRMATAFV